MEGKHLVIICSLTICDQMIQTHALIDCGATGIAFMDRDFAGHHQVPLQELKKRRQVEVIDGRTIESGNLTHLASVSNGSKLAVQFRVRVGTELEPL